MRSLLILDGDLISYKAAAASEKRTIKAKHKTTGEVTTYKNRTALKAALKTSDTEVYEDFDIEDVQKIDAINNCFKIIDGMIASIHKTSGCDDVRVVVQGEGNFRDDLLLPSKYKGSRVGTMRPLQLKAAAEYLKEKHKAEVANGRESDDVLSSYAYMGFKDNIVIVQGTIDKDARQCSGWLLDWDKMTAPEYISGLGELHMDEKGKLRGKGRKWLYAQVTMGDPSDDYKPTELSKSQYGEASVLKDFGPLTTDKECWTRIAELYKLWYPSPFIYTAWSGEEVQGNWLQMLQIYVDCAHMQRWDGDRLDVTVTLNKMGVNIDV
jgi:hypothetical protein